MLSPAVLFVAIGHIFAVYSKPAQDIDFNTILNLAQQASQKNKQLVNDGKYESASAEDNQGAGLSSKDILELLQKLSASQFQSVKNDYRNPLVLNNEYAKKYKNKERNDADTYGPYDQLTANKIDADYKYENVQQRNKYRDEYKRLKESRFNELALEELLSQNVLKNQYQNRPKLKLNNLVGFDTNDKSVNDDAGGYSKVYVILNPRAIEKSRNKEELNNLLTKILSLTASALGKEQGERITEGRYKGFPVKAGLLMRRRLRDSRENGAGKDDADDDYKPKKRYRNDRNGGGGGGAGRTAIPYIRHRGDIYERDN